MTKPQGKSQHRPPEGQIRLSQLVTTFGPGAMVDLVHHAVLIGGLDYWRYDNKSPTPSLDEPRLRERVWPRVKALGLTLAQDGAFRTGPPGKDESGPWNGIQVAEFPAWFICQHCRALSHRKGLEEKNERYRHQCTRTQVGECVPVRFVATCNDGHLDEFPWNWFVHQSGERCDGRSLYLYEGATGDFTEIVVRCKDCNAQRALADAREDKVLPECKGRRPWLGHQADDPSCKHRQHLLSRTASNAYFSQTVSALSIPEKGRELRAAVSSTKVWPMLEKATTPEKVRQLREMIGMIDASISSIIGKPASDYSDQELADAVRAVHGGENAPREGLRTAEFRQLLTAKNEKPGELPPEREDFFASRLVPDEPLPSSLADVTLVKKLRRVTAQVGFTRLSAPVPDLQGEYDESVTLAPLTLAESWLPATEIRGEGVFLRFREEVMREWEERDVVKERALALYRGFEKRFGDSAASLFPGPRYFMLHSLSHLLMTAMSLECGYAAASLGERIYCAPATDPVPMAAILILTGSSGAEGTLGGLVEQGRRITHHLRRAYDIAELCSNDPVCAGHRPGENDHTERYLEGAACHGCLYVAEPSCERFNSYLDRALVVPALGHPRGLAFLGARP